MIAQKHRRRIYLVPVLLLLFSEALALTGVALLFAAGDSRVPRPALLAAVGVCAAFDVYLLTFWPRGGYSALWARRRRRRMDAFLKQNIPSEPSRGCSPGCCGDTDEERPR